MDMEHLSFSFFKKANKYLIFSSSAEKSSFFTKIYFPLPFQPYSNSKLFLRVPEMAVNNNHFNGQSINEAELKKAK
jgi:hypothetical protein